MAKPFGKPKELTEAARQMAGWCEDFMKKSQSGVPLYTKDEAAKLLALIGDAAASKKWTADPEATMHLTWAYLALRNQMKMDPDKAALDKLGATIPTRVRQPPYSDANGDPKTVGATLRQRLDLFGKYDPREFTQAFEGIAGKK